MLCQKFITNKTHFIFHILNSISTMQKKLWLVLRLFNLIYLMLVRIIEITFFQEKFALKQSICKDLY